MDLVFTAEREGYSLMIAHDADDNLIVETAGEGKGMAICLTKHQTTEMLEELNEFRLARFDDHKTRIARAVAAMHMAAAEFPEGTMMELTLGQMNSLAKAALGLG